MGVTIRESTRMMLGKWDYVYISMSTTIPLSKAKTNETVTEKY